ncbi:MAG: hypothetical protein WBH15_06900, partial [Candidatus Methanoculleus thermohydrogenotrophicum]
MDPRFRSRLVATIILLVVVCSAFSVSQVAGFRLENRDGSGTAAALAEALVLQQSTKIREEFIENLTVYIDSQNKVFEQDPSGHALGLYVPEENAIYIRSDQHPERADDVFTEQVGYRVYHSMGFKKSKVFPTLIANPGSYLAQVSPPAGEEREAALFANAFMLYHISPDLLKEDAPTIYTYMDLLVKSGGDRTTVD